MHGLGLNALAGIESWLHDTKWLICKTIIIIISKIIPVNVSYVIRTGMDTHECGTQPFANTNCFKHLVIGFRVQLECAETRRVIIV